MGICALRGGTGGQGDTLVRRTTGGSWTVFGVFMKVILLWTGRDYFVVTLIDVSTSPTLPTVSTHTDLDLLCYQSYKILNNIHSTSHKFLVCDVTTLVDTLLETTTYITYTNFHYRAHIKLHSLLWY